MAKLVMVCGFVSKKVFNSVQKTTVSFCNFWQQQQSEVKLAKFKFQMVWLCVKKRFAKDSSVML
jgi:hypothetical protein